MNSPAIKELYLKAYSETTSEYSSSDAIEMQKLKRDAEQKLSSVLAKATSEDTKSSLNELAALYEKQEALSRVNAFALGFRKGAKLMNEING